MPSLDAIPNAILNADILNAAILCAIPDAIKSMLPTH